MCSAEGNVVLTPLQRPKTQPPKTNLLLVFMTALILVGIGAGIYAQIVGHHHAFANTREMPWGMLIGAYAYFAIISTGLCIMAALTHLVHIRRLEPLVNRMVWMSIIMIFSAFFIIGLEIENPWRMPLGVLLHPNFFSNIWWMGTLYGLAVSFMIVEFFLIFTGRTHAAFILGIFAVVTEVCANSNLGAVFASLNARPFWYGAQLPVFFLACAFLSGAAAVILFTHLAHVLQGRKLSEETRPGIRYAARVMMIMLFLIGLATLWKYANSYCGTEEMAKSADALLRGPLAMTFWFFEVGVGLIAPFLLAGVTRLRSVPILSLAAFMVLVGQFFSRYNLVVAGLLVPQFGQYCIDAPYYLSYTPTISENLFIVGSLGVVGFGFLFGERFFGHLFWKQNTSSEE